MSVCYVIKNKEGKYYSRNLLNPDNFLFENRLVDCEFFATEEIARFEITFNELKDCKVVEITIAEGDLEQQLAKKDKEIEELKQQFLYSQASQTQQEQIDKLNTFVASQAISTSQIRKQVCDEIRDFIQKNESPSFSQSLCGYWFISAKKLFEYLDQIEQGKEGMK